MSYFKKARNYTKSSTSLDEKIAKANREYEKTGVDSVELVEITNSTSGVYYAGIDHPEEPPVQSEVPDSNGFRSRDPSLPAENASDIDPSDPSTWETGGQGMDHLINPNDLPVIHGDNGVETQSTVKDQPILLTPDLTGFSGLRVDPNGAVNDMGKYGGIAYTYNLGVWGRTEGVIGPGNKFVSVLAAFGWPTGPLVDPGHPDYPSDRAIFGFYRYDDNATYAARLRMKELYANGLPSGSWKPVKCWMNFNSYGFGMTWTQYKANPNNIWRSNGDAYVTVHVYDAANKYNSSETVPPYTTVIFKDDIGKPENLGIGGKLKGFLENLFGLAGSAAQGLLDAVGDAGDAIGDFIGDTVDDLADRFENIPNFMGPEEAIQDAKDKFQEAWDNFKDFAGQLPPPAAEYSMNIAGSILQNKPVYVNENDIPQSDIDNLVNNIPIGSIQVNNGSPANYADENIYVDDNGNTHSNIGPNGEKEYYHNDLTNWMGGGTGVFGYGNPLAAAGQAQAQVVIPDDGSPPYFQYTDHAYHNQNSDDPGEVPDAIKAFFSDLVHGAGAILHGNQNENTGGMSGYPSNSTADIKGDVITQFNVPLDQMPQHIQDYVQTEINYQNMVSSGQIQNPMSGYEHLMPEEKKNRNKTSFLNESTFLTEKNHLRSRREAKRALVEKKVGNKVMKINIPGPKDHLTVKAIDMLRQYKVSEKEKQEYAIIIGRINQWIRENPKEYAIWKVRYPANDPRLAELNWRLDQQLKASDEYMDSHFPENERLFAKLQNKIQTNINVTDPRNFVDVKPAVTHKQLLQVSKALGESTWKPLDSKVANKTTQTFGLIGDFGLEELGPDGNQVTANFGGLGGVESQPSQFEYKAQEGNPVTVSPPTYKSLSLAGYAKPLPWKMARKKNAKKAEEINTQLDSSESYTKEINADALMKARVEEAGKIYEREMKKWEAKKKSVDAYNDKLADKQEALMDKANKIWDAIHAKYYQGDDWSGKPYYSKTAEEMSKEYLSSGGAEIDAKLEALGKAFKDEPPLPDFPDVYDDNYWNDGLNSETNKVTPSKDPSSLEKLFTSLKAGFWQMTKITQSMLTNKQVHANPTSKQINVFAKNINKTQLSLIPVSQTPIPYSDSNFKEVNGKLVQHHGNSPDYTKNMAWGGEGSEIGDRGSAMLQIVTPKDGEPYILYTDHAYINTNNPDDATAFQDFGAEVVQAVSKSKPTGGMDGVYGDVKTEFSIPVSSLTKAQQEAVFLNHNFRKKKNIDESLFKKLGKKR